MRIKHAMLALLAAQVAVVHAFRAGTIRMLSS